MSLKVNLRDKKCVGTESFRFFFHVDKKMIGNRMTLIRERRFDLGAYHTCVREVSTRLDFCGRFLRAFAIRYLGVCVRFLYSFEKCLMFNVSSMGTSSTLWILDISFSYLFCSFESDS